MTQTTTDMSVRQVLQTIRRDSEDESYLSGARQYPCDQGTLWVRNRPASGGGSLLGLFEAELVDDRGECVRKYKV